MTLKVLAATALAFALAGCIRTAEMPLAPNVLRLDTRAEGLLFTGQSTTQTMRVAAERTLQNGYTHFRFADASMGQGTQYGGTNVVLTRYGAFANNVNVPTSQVGVTVYMFHANEPGARGAFDAAQVLRSMQQ